MALETSESEALEYLAMVAAWSEGLDWERMDCDLIFWLLAYISKCVKRYCCVESEYGPPSHQLQLVCPVEFFSGMPPELPLELVCPGNLMHSVSTPLSASPARSRSFRAYIRFVNHLWDLKSSNGRHRSLSSCLMQAIYSRSSQCDS